MCQVCKIRPVHKEPNGSEQAYCGKTCAREAARLQSTPRQPKKILFYNRDEPYYGFTNFSEHVVRYQGRDYPTSEHLFQAFKFLSSRPDIAEQIRRCKTPRDAFELAHRHQSDVCRDWSRVRIAKMDIVIREKFTYHTDLKQQLLGTGDALLVENSRANDAFWGNGDDGNGRNELGLALMRLRKSLRAQDASL